LYKKHTGSTRSTTTSSTRNGIRGGFGYHRGASINRQAKQIRCKKNEADQVRFLVAFCRLRVIMLAHDLNGLKIYIYSIQIDMHYDVQF